ncbi:MAG TPA: hypothetical protein VHI13_03895 [Candidatus Kapabacteria bacterium]|nr:hypothetical protein [Candidatus Kapabacteria bacterium]
MNNPHFDTERAAAMIGKHIIIGLELHDRQDNHIDNIQLHGHILRVNADEGVVVHLIPSGVEYAMPAVLSAYEPAEPGDYEFQSTGEIVSNPDLMASWVVYEPEDWGDAPPAP